MKTYYIAELEKKMEIVEFFMLKSIEIRVGSNKKEYIDIALCDKTGDISAKKWDVTDSDRVLIEEAVTGDIVKVKAQTNEWQGNIQLKVSRIRIARESDEIEISDFVKAAPEDTVEMYDYIYKTANEIKDEDFRKVAKRVLTDNRNELLYYPAASKNHHAEYGGLLYHMKRMLMSGMALCEIYTDLDMDLVVTGVIIHDIEKINEIMADCYGVSSGYSLEGQMLGHIIQGVREIGRICNELAVPEEKALMLEHMILTHHYEPEFGSPKKPMFPEGELLHYLDVLDARMYDMEDALRRVEPGGLSERIRTLDNRKIYRPTFYRGGKQEGK